MIRYMPDGADTMVRYDGTETRVDIRRAGHDAGLSVEELRMLVDVLRDALYQRLRFLRECAEDDRTPAEAYAHGLGAQDG